MLAARVRRGVVDFLLAHVTQPVAGVHHPAHQRGLVTTEVADAFGEGGGVQQVEHRTHARFFEEGVWNEQVVAFTGKRHEVQPEGLCRSVDAEAAIRRAGELLVTGGYAEPEYVGAMLRREELATTCLGMGIAIPHGTSDARERVLHSGIVVLQYPGGVDFGGEKVHLVVGIAGVGDAHLDILARLSASFEDEELLQRLMTATDPKIIYDNLK